MHEKARKKFQGVVNVTKSRKGQTSDSLALAIRKSLIILKKFNFSGLGVPGRNCLRNEWEVRKYSQQDLNVSRNLALASQKIG